MAPELAWRYAGRLPKDMADAPGSTRNPAEAPRSISAFRARNQSRVDAVRTVSQVISLHDAVKSRFLGDPGLARNALDRLLPIWQMIRARQLITTAGQGSGCR